MTRAARRALARTLPPAIAAWVERAAAASPSPEEALNLAGTLASIAALLESSYRKSGASVSEEVFALHGLILRGEEGAAGRAGNSEFARWLLSFRNKNEEARRLMIQWIEIAAERLTMRRYARGGDRLRHARHLIAAPVRFMLGVGAVPETCLYDFSEVILAFWDHLDSKRQSELGRNRIGLSLAGDFGGFYAISEDVQPPTAEAEGEALLALGAQVRALESSPAMSAWMKAMLGEMLAAIEHRRTEGHWPEAMRVRTSGERDARDSWLERIVARFR